MALDAAASSRMEKSVAVVATPVPKIGCALERAAGFNSHLLRGMFHGRFAGMGRASVANRMTPNRRGFDSLSVRFYRPSASIASLFQLRSRLGRANNIYVPCASTTRVIDMRARRLAPASPSLRNVIVRYSFSGLLRL